MKQNLAENRLKEIKSLKDKADMLASIHSRLSDRFARWHTVISSTLLFLSTALVGLTFISEDFVYESVGVSPNTLKWIIGIVSILNFSGIVLLAEWRFQDKATSHREAVRFYFGIVNRIRKVLDAGDEITEQLVEEVRIEYGRTQALPKIPDADFLLLKQWHLQKIAISRELSKNPFEPITAIKKKLQNKTDEQQ